MSNVKTLSQQMIDLIESEVKDEEEKSVKIRKFESVNRSTMSEIVNTLGSTSGLTPLMSACRHLNVDLVKRLVDEFAADVNKCDRRGNASPLIHTFKFIANSSVALSSSQRSLLQADIVEFLLKHGANPNARDLFGTTPLMMVDSQQIARLLIEAGAKVNIKDSMHLSPFMHSLIRRLYPVARLLLEHGADLNEPDFAGKIAMDYFDSTAPLDFKLVFLSRYLEPLCIYFRDSDFNTISADIDRFIEHSTDENLFPIKTNHVLAMNILAWDMNSWSSTSRDEKVLSALEIINLMPFLPYFSSTDFNEKMWADVLNRLGDDNVVVDGQLLLGRIARAKSKRELDELNATLERFRKKCKLTKEFHDAFMKAKKKLFDYITPLLGPDIDLVDEIKEQLRTYLDKFDEKE